MSRFGVFLIFLSITMVLGLILYITNPLKIIAHKNDTQRINDLAKIAVALEKYNETYGNYPRSDTETFEILSSGGEKISWGSPLLPFIDPLPKDPSFNRKYIYFSDEQENKTFQIYASLENPESVETFCFLAHPRNKCISC